VHLRSGFQNLNTRRSFGGVYIYKGGVLKSKETRGRKGNLCVAGYCDVLEITEPTVLLVLN
jgi:hypothetical protein